VRDRRRRPAAPPALDHRLIDLLVCPLCKGPLQDARDAEQRPHELACPADRLAFPIRDGIPVMLESEARALDDTRCTAPSPAAVSFTVLIPARLASTRLPDKPLADIAGLPMVVRVAQRAALSGAARWWWPRQHPRIVEACAAHGCRRADPRRPRQRQRPPGRGLRPAGLDDDDLVVNVQGDEPLIDPALVARLRGAAGERPTA
jgi:uncharacterized protein YbaR (Trm112 family)